MEDYIYTNKNEKIIVDSDLKWKFEGYPWHVTNHGIVARAKRVSDPDWYPKHLVCLAREIFNFPPNNYRIVHINGDKLDCRKSNLRLYNTARAQEIELGRKHQVNQA